ncbi:response regulator with CheY-like receiver domain and winged-helix DNA-binding domain [Owenweeksia hongkongensis DSM 17368]|uniref:Response regulator with CheY-like receiver domain and winged-helix DNA-binding domain n=2 Tax=Owenweeksia TaxID=267986 RepID=G8R6C9_OWEHD|nr:response regulator with CheY-like receiver domain and winged-helix DNA-binding domain [Owenweeksia hongkongensis DSM 17368]
MVSNYDAMKVLIAEDHPLLLQSVCWKVQKEGFEVQGVVDGQQAKDFFISYQPDIVITDFMMPFVTGPEFIHFIRHEQNSNVPIMVLSQMGLEEEKVRCFDLGADDYLTKPFLPGELIARLNRFKRMRLAV